MNELLFIVHVVVAMIITIIAAHIGKEALIALACVEGILSNLLITKQVTLFSFHVTACDVFAVGVILTLNLLQELYGSEAARKTITINFFILIAYLIFSQLHLLYLPNQFDMMHHHYQAILSFMPRIALASLVVYFMTQTVDALIFRWLKQHYPHRSLTQRSVTSSSISQLLDTILFSFAGLYGIVEHIGDIIIMSYAIKMLVIIFSSPFVALSARICQRKS